MIFGGRLVVIVGVNRCGNIVSLYFGFCDGGVVCFCYDFYVIYLYFMFLW